MNLWLTGGSIMTCHHYHIYEWPHLHIIVNAIFQKSNLALNSSVSQPPMFLIEQKPAVLLLLYDIISFHTLSMFDFPDTSRKMLEKWVLYQREPRYVLMLKLRPQWATLCTFVCRLLVVLCVPCVCVCLSPFYICAIKWGTTAAWSHDALPSSLHTVPAPLTAAELLSSTHLWWWVTLTPRKALFIPLQASPAPPPAAHNLIAEHSPTPPPFCLIHIEWMTFPENNDQSIGVFPHQALSN